MPAIIDRVVAQQVGDELYCHKQLLGKSDKLNNSHNRTCQNEPNPALKKYQYFMRMAARKLRFNYSFMASNQTKSSQRILIALAVNLILVATFPTIDCLANSLEQHQYLHNHHHHHQNPQHQLPVNAAVQMAQARAGGLEPGDYVDEAGELDVLVNQQQIPTAQLMAAAGHVVPENFFLPGGSIPALYAHRYQQQSQQLQQQQQQQQQQHHHQQHHQQQQQQHQHQHQQQQQQHHHHALEQMQQAASNVQARHVAPNKFIRQADLIAAASAAAEQADQSPLIDFNGYNMVAAASQQDARENPTDLSDYINSPSGQTAALYEQQQHQHYAEQQVAAELAALMAANNQQNLQHQLHQQQQQQQQQQQHNLDGGLHPSASNENMLAESVDNYAASIGPAYQISGNPHSQDQYSGQYDNNNNNREQQKPYGLPTKSSSRKPSGMLEPLGNPKTISSPIIDLVANQMPKTSNLEKLAEKLPPVQTPTVFSFASSKDPSEKVKQVNQKKRTVMRQAEHLARAMIKSINDKFGTTIGDQSDIPFLLSALGPLGMAQNILFDPTLLVTLLNSAEKTYFSDVLPSPAKSAIRPVLNIFRVPNKKRDKANLLNIISFIASGGQVPASTPPKHRQGTGVEKMSKNKNRR